MRTKILWVLALVTLVFASCNNDNDVSVVNDGQVRFSSGVLPDQTRVKGENGDQWEGDEAIGIYMIEHGEELAAASIQEGAGNVKYTTASTGPIATFTSGNPIYYPVNGPLVDFIAYHPHSTAINDFLYTLDVLDQTNQSAIDLMTASNNNQGNGFGKDYMSAVELKFEHRLAKVILHVSAGDGVGSLSGLDVKVKGIYNTVTLDLKDFSWNAIGTVGTPVITPYYNADTNDYELILPPTAQYYSLSDCKVEFTVGGNTYAWAMSDNTGNIDKFESGRKYTFNVVLTKNKVQVSGTIEPWVVENGGTGTAN